VPAAVRLQRTPHLEMPPLTTSVRVRVEMPEGEQRENGRAVEGKRCLKLSS
jgi:hypothetical protein